MTTPMTMYTAVPRHQPLLVRPPWLCPWDLTTAECECHAAMGSRCVRTLVHTASEFLDMGRFLILGAVAVGFFKVLMVEQVLLSFQSNTCWAVGVLMLLAVLLSVCSEADAFVAASFSSFPGAAQLSFMALGPMVDLKLIFMYGSVFRKTHNPGPHHSADSCRVLSFPPAGTGDRVTS